MGEGLSAVVDRDQLERGFRRLSIEHRAVVVLHHYLDLPLEQIAETLGVPPGRPIPTSSCDARAARGARRRRAADVAGGCSMSTDRDTTRIVRSWLEEGRTTLPDWVRDDVFDQLPATPQRRSRWTAWRFLTMPTAAKTAVAAAAVIRLIAVGALTFLQRPNRTRRGADPVSNDHPTPTAHAAADLESPASRSGRGRNIPRDEVPTSSSPCPRVGTSSEDGRPGAKNERCHGGRLTFWRPDIWAEAGRVRSPEGSIGTGPTADDLLAALRSGQHGRLRTRRRHDRRNRGAAPGRLGFRGRIDPAACRRRPCCNVWSSPTGDGNDARGHRPLGLRIYVGERSQAVWSSRCSTNPTATARTLPSATQVMESMVTRR